MRKRPWSYYIVIMDNKAIVKESNILALYEALRKTDPDFNYVYRTIQRRFQKTDYFSIKVGEKVYYFQKVL